MGEGAYLSFSGSRVGAYSRLGAYSDKYGSPEVLLFDQEKDKSKPCSQGARQRDI